MNASPGAIAAPAGVAQNERRSAGVRLPVFRRRPRRGPHWRRSSRSAARRRTSRPRSRRARRDEAPRRRSRTTRARCRKSRADPRSTPQRASPSSASQRGWKVRAARLVERCAGLSHLGDEGRVAASILPIVAVPHQHAMTTGAPPVDPPDARRGGAVEPSRMSASVMPSEDSTPSASCASTARSACRGLRWREARCGSKVVPLEGQRPVVVGEAEDGPSPGQPPAPGRAWSPRAPDGPAVVRIAGHADLDQRDRRDLPGRSNPVRLTSRWSMSKRTGTSNAKPAVIAAPSAGAAVGRRPRRSGSTREIAARHDAADGDEDARRQRLVIGR